MNLEGKDYFTSQPLPGKNRNPSICLAETCRHCNVSHEIDCPEPDIKSILFGSSIYCFAIYLPPLPHCLDLLFPLGVLRFSPFCTHCYIHPPTHPPTPRCGCRVDVPAVKTVLRLSITSSTDTQCWPPSQTGSAALPTEQHEQTHV